MECVARHTSVPLMPSLLRSGGGGGGGEAMGTGSLTRTAGHWLSIAPDFYTVADFGSHSSSAIRKGKGFGFD